MASRFVVENSKTMGRLLFSISLIILLSLALLTPASAQLNPAFPLIQGGFQQGTTLADNGWEVANGSAVNGWAIGGNYPGATDGRCAYTTNEYQSSNPGATLGSVTNTANQVVHLYRTVNLPAADSAIFLQFRYAAAHNATHFLSVVIDTVFFNLINSAPIGSPIWSFSVNSSGGFVAQNVQIPPVFAGRQVRLRFEARPLGIFTAGANLRGFALDDVTIQTRPYTGQLIRATATGGNWADSTTWENRLVPSLGEDVLIPSGATVVADLRGIAGARSLTVLGTVQGTVTGGPQGSIQTRSSLAVSGQMLIRDRQLRIGGEITMLPGGLIDLRRGGLTFDSSDLFTSRRTLRMNSADQFQGKIISTLSCLAPEGVLFDIGGSTDTLKVYTNLFLGVGLLEHRGKLLLDNSIAVSQAAAAANPASFIMSIQRGSMESFPLISATTNLELRYSHTTTQQQPLLLGSRNEVPSNRRIGRLSVGTAFSYLRIDQDLWLTDNVNNTLWLLGPISVDAGKRVVLLNTGANTGVSTANQGLIQGKLVLTLNSATALTKRFPVGLGGIPNHFELRGITTSGEAKIGVEAVPAGAATPSSPITALSPLARIRVTMDSGTVTNVSQVAALYTVADGILPEQVANLRIGTSSTLNGVYTSIGPSAAPTGSPIASNTGTYATNAFYSIGLAGGGFRKLWTGSAGTDSWDTPENWSGNTVPSCADTVVLSPQFFTVRLTGDRQVGSLEIGPQTTLELQSGSRLRVGCNTGTGRLVITGVSTGHFYGIKALPGSTLRVE